MNPSSQAGLQIRYVWIPMVWDYGMMGLQDYTYVRTYVHTYIDTYIHAHTHTYTCVYTHVYIHSISPFLIAYLVAFQDREKTSVKPRGTRSHLFHFYKALRFGEDSKRHGDFIGIKKTNIFILILIPEQIAYAFFKHIPNFVMIF